MCLSPGPGLMLCEGHRCVQESPSAPCLIHFIPLPEQLPLNPEQRCGEQGGSPRGSHRRSLPRRDYSWESTHCSFGNQHTHSPWQPQTWERSRSISGWFQLRKAQISVVHYGKAWLMLDASLSSAGDDLWTLGSRHTGDGPSGEPFTGEICGVATSPFKG